MRAQIKKEEPPAPLAPAVALGRPPLVTTALEVTLDKPPANARAKRKPIPSNPKASPKPRVATPSPPPLQLTASLTPPASPRSQMIAYYRQAKIADQARKIQRYKSWFE